MLKQASTLHVRFEGRSFDVPLSDLDIGLDSEDRTVKNRLAEYLNVRENQFSQYAVDRHDTGNLTVRPQAVFG